MTNLWKTILELEELEKRQRISNENSDFDIYNINTLNLPVEPGMAIWALDHATRKRLLASVALPFFLELDNWG